MTQHHGPFAPARSVPTSLRSVWTRLGRRGFLHGLGAAAMCPLLPILNSSGAEPTVPRRLVLFYTPHGAVWDKWVPTGTPTNFTLSPILSPLERHKKKLTVLAGLAMPDAGVGAPHTKGPALLWGGSKLLDDGSFNRSDCSGGCTFGWNASPSVDQIIASAISPPTAYRSIELGVRCGGSHPATRMIYTAAQQPLHPEVDPWKAFGRLFGGPLTASELEIRRRERRSVLDLVTTELNQLHTLAPSADRPKIEAHLAAIRGLETRFDRDAAACAPPQNLATGALPANDPANMPTVMEGQFDLLAAALACDLTRIASYQHTIGDNDGTTHTWLGHTDSHHSMSHAADSDEATWGKMAEIETWYASQFAGLLDRLDAIPEGDGTLLDHTLVVWGSELGKANTHSFRNTPFVLAGGASGEITPGRFLSFDGDAHARLLVAMCHAMGATQIESVGNLDSGKGPLAGLLA